MYENKLRVLKKGRNKQVPTVDKFGFGFPLFLENFLLTLLDSSSLFVLLEILLLHSTPAPEELLSC
jgi:hypothetical protein